MRQRKQILTTLVLICGLAWIAAAIRPLDRQAWLLENLLLLISAALLLALDRRLQFSIASYFCIAAFVILHIAGAHYTYAQMPLGLWVRDNFGLGRNHYDRFTHFAFGFLLVFPIRELLLRFSGIAPSWSYWLAGTTIVGISGFFEIIEASVAAIVAPGQGVEWLGGQGDEWDAQNDMLAAMIGAILMMVFSAIWERSRNRK